MSQVTDSIKQENPQSPTRQSLSALNKVTLVASLGQALFVIANFLIVWLLHGAFVPEFFIGIVPALIVVGLLAGRVRWAPALGAVQALLTATLFLANPNAQDTLTHPGSGFIDFIAEVIVLAFVLIVVVAGVGATVQNYRGGMPRPQRWLQPFLTGLTGIVVGMLIVSALAAANPATSSASSTGGEATVHMTAHSFAQNVVLVSKGSRLLIVDDTSVEHILQNGMWTNTTPRTITEPGAPVVHNVDITGGSVQIGPFTTAGIFHIYCTIHQGMNLTIVVQ
jgi:plastocyanin